MTELHDLKMPPPPERVDHAVAIVAAEREARLEYDATRPQTGETPDEKVILAITVGVLRYLDNGMARILPGGAVEWWHCGDGCWVPFTPGFNAYMMEVRRAYGQRMKEWKEQHTPYTGGAPA